MKLPSIEDFEVIQAGRTVHVRFRPTETEYTFHAPYGLLSQSCGVYYGDKDDFGDYRKSEIFEFAKTLAKAKLKAS